MKHFKSFAIVNSHTNQNLLKPTRDERLQKTIEKLKAALQARRAP